MLFDGESQYLRAWIPAAVPVFLLFRLKFEGENLGMSTWEYILARLGDICTASSMNAKDLNSLFFRLSMSCTFPFVLVHLEGQLRASRSVLFDAHWAFCVFSFQFALIILLAMTAAWAVRIVWTEADVTVRTVAVFAHLGGPALSATKVSTVHWIRLKGSDFVLELWQWR